MQDKYFNNFLSTSKISYYKTITILMFLQFLSIHSLLSLEHFLPTLEGDFFMELANCPCFPSLSSLYFSRPSLYLHFYRPFPYPLSKFIFLIVFSFFC